MTNKNNSATDEPGKHPRQSSQIRPTITPANNVVDQEANKKNAGWDKGNPAK